MNQQNENKQKDTADNKSAVFKYLYGEEEGIRYELVYEGEKRYTRIIREK